MPLALTYCKDTFGMSVVWCRLPYMAKKQTRRTVSINRPNYEATQRAATLRGMTVAGLVEFALGTIGVPVVVHPQQAPELVGSITARRGKSSALCRRSVSLNRQNYEAAKREAGVRGMSIAGLIELALRSIGVPGIALQRSSPEALSPRLDHGRTRSTALRDREMPL